MNTSKKFFSIIIMLFTSALALMAVTSLVACGNDNTAGTDEQPNSITAALDSATTEWFQEHTLVAPETQSSPCIDCPHDIIIHDPTDDTQAPKIQAENGYLYHVANESFESIVCENDSNWFVYSVSVNDSVTQKRLTLPDSSTAEAFEADCEEESGAFVSDTATTIEGQHSFNCSLTIPNDETSSDDRTKYVDAYWKKYVELIIGICRN
ncbi:MAG: hypothetical protein IKB43_11425 [Fibrobacter sp.]|nr:hypothetical protein [Fibrobacter sp.]